jgi:hypothetical protein
MTELLPLLRKVRNTVYHFVKDRKPIIDGLGYRTALKESLNEEIEKSLEHAFTYVIGVSEAHKNKEVSAIILINRWTGKLVEKEFCCKRGIPRDLIVDDGIIIDCIGSHFETDIILPRLIKFPGWIEQISVHTHFRGDVEPSEEDLETIADRFDKGIDDIHFIISYDRKKNLIRYTQFKDIFDVPDPSDDIRGMIE